MAPILPSWLRPSPTVSVTLTLTGGPGQHGAKLTQQHSPGPVTFKPLRPDEAVLTGRLKKVDLAQKKFFAQQTRLLSQLFPQGVDRIEREGDGARLSDAQGRQAHVSLRDGPAVFVPAPAPPRREGANPFAAVGQRLAQARLPGPPKPSVPRADPASTAPAGTGPVLCDSWGRPLADRTIGIRDSVLSPDGTTRWCIGTDDRLYRQSLPRLGEPAIPGYRGIAFAVELPGDAPSCVGFVAGQGGDMHQLEVRDRHGERSFLFLDAAGHWQSGWSRSRSYLYERPGAATGAQPVASVMVDRRGHAIGLSDQGGLLSRRQGDADWQALLPVDAATQRPRLGAVFSALQTEPFGRGEALALMRAPGMAAGEHAIVRLWLTGTGQQVPLHAGRDGARLPLGNQRDLPGASFDVVKPASPLRCYAMAEGGRLFWSTPDHRLFESVGDGAPREMPSPVRQHPGQALASLAVYREGGEQVLVALLRSPAGRGHLYRFDPRTHAWLALSLPVALDVERVESTRTGQLALHAGGARQLYRSGRLQPDPGEAGPIGRPSVSATRRVHWKLPGLARQAGQVGPTVGGVSAVSGLKDLAGAAKAALTAPVRLPVRVAKAVGQKVKGRHGLRGQGLYDDVGQAFASLRTALQTPALRVGGLQARIDAVAARDPALAASMRAEERAILRDLAGTLRFVGMLHGRPEAGLPVSKRQGPSRRRDGAELLSSLEVHLALYRRVRGRTSAPPELAELKTLLADLRRGGLRLPFPDPVHPRRQADPGDLLLGRIGLCLQQLHELEQLTHAPDAARFAQARQAWARHPVRIYTDAGMMTVRDVERAYGVLKMMRTALTDPRSIAFKAARRAFGVKTPDDLRHFLEAHVKDMDPPELVKLSRVLSLGAGGAFGFLGAWFVTFGLSGMQHLEWEFKGGGRDGMVQVYARNNQGVLGSLGLRAGVDLKPLPLRAEAVPALLSYSRLRDGAGVHAFVPVARFPAFLDRLLDRRRPIDLPGLIGLCTPFEKARFKEDSLQVNAFGGVGFVPAASARSDTLGLRAMLGISARVALLALTRQKLEFLNARDGRPERGIEPQWRDGAGAWEAALGFFRGTAVARGAEGAVRPQADVGAFDLGLQVRVPNEDNLKAQLRWRVPERVQPAEWRTLLEAAAEACPGHRAAIAAHARVLERHGLDAFVASAPALRADAQRHWQAEGCDATRASFLHALDLLALQDGCARDKRPMVTGIRLEPRHSKPSRLRRGGPLSRLRQVLGRATARPAGAASPEERLRQWAKDDPALDTVLEAIERAADVTRVKVRYAMRAEGSAQADSVELQPSAVIALNRLVAGPGCTVKALEDFLCDPRHHRIDRIVLLTADTHNTGGGIGMGVTASDTASFVSERTLGTLVFHHDGADDAVPSRFTMDEDLSRFIAAANPMDKAARKAGWRPV